VEAVGQHPVGNADVAGPGEHEETVFADRGIERRAHAFPVREKLGERTRVHDRAGENVSADFRSFFDQANADFLVSLARKLFQPNCSGKPGRSAAHDYNIVFHGFSLHRLPRFLARVSRIWLGAPASRMQSGCGTLFNTVSYGK
jgi:hypothetical protein